MTSASRPAVPAFASWQADPGWHAIDLISDLHLSEATPRTFAAFRDHLLGTPADAVLVLGDLFEVWVGDDVRLGGFGRECLGVLREATRRRAVGFMHGNRDFLVGAATLAEGGVFALEDPTLAIAFGVRLVLTHGDLLCLDDTDYQRFRSEVRRPAWRAAFLGRPLAERQVLARSMRDASRAHQAAQARAKPSDADPAEAARWMALAGTDAIVHGHTHRPAVHAAADGRVRHVLGDWDFDTPNARARILRWTREGLRPIDLAGR